MLDKFDYTSNTIAGCANQHYFETDGDTVYTSRAYFRIDAGGEFGYSLLFSGVHDSSYRKISMANQRCDNWKILKAEVAKCPAFPEGIAPETLDPNKDLSHTDFLPLTFDGGERSKAAVPDFFYTDPIRLSFCSGEFLCLQLTYSGVRIPCHPETLVPIYSLGDDGWKYTADMPLPCMIGCDRPTVGTVAFLGDSITQGCGTPTNAYTHLTARLAEKLGYGYSYLNLGIGFGKASDAATDCSWLARAKKCDTVFVCFGVNDINDDCTADSIKKSLRVIVAGLRESGCRVILETVPPFDYPEPRRAVWNEVNAYITEELSALCDKVFDVRDVLSKSPDEPYAAKYSGHPNEEGCAIWAEALYGAVRDMFP